MSHHGFKRSWIIDGSSAQAGILSAWLLFGLALIYLLVWTALPLLIDAEVPHDNIEELEWAKTLALGYPKHPPMPSWIIYVVTKIFPAGVPTTYVLGAVQVALMLSLAWLIGRQLLGGREACFALLLIAGITFYANRMHYFNHNTVLLAATAATVYCLWNAARSRKLRWWLALGVCWGLGMMSKYEMVVTGACNLAYLWTLRSRDTASLLCGVVTAGVVCILLSTPHVLWVLDNNATTVNYAMNYMGVVPSVPGRLLRMLSFNADQLLRLLPALLLIGIARKWHGSMVESEAGPPARSATTGSSQEEERSDARRFLAIHAWGPLVVMNLLCLLTGLRLGMHWAVAFLWLLPLWYVATDSGRKLVRIPMPIMLASTALVQGLMVLAFVLTK